MYSDKAINLTTSFRTYKLLHIGEEPKYLVDFVETPQLDSPFGTRSYSEHGIIGMPAALANALSLASRCRFRYISNHSRNHFQKEGGIT